MIFSYSSRFVRVHCGRGERGGPFVPHVAAAHRVVDGESGDDRARRLHTQVRARRLRLLVHAEQCAVGADACVRRAIDRRAARRVARSLALAAHTLVLVQQFAQLVPSLLQDDDDDDDY